MDLDLAPSLSFCSHHRNSGIPEVLHDHHIAWGTDGSPRNSASTCAGCAFASQRRERASGMPGAV